jgi:membrane dipeptidase
MEDWKVGHEAARIHSNALVWDCHGCMPLQADDRFLPQLARYRTSGVDMVLLNVGGFGQSLDAHVRVLAYMRDWLLERPEEYVLGLCVDDIQRAKREGKLAVAFDIEGCAVLGEQPSLVSAFYALGVRWMLIAYNRNNPVGGGCQDDDPGLSALGRRVVDEMERVGMLVCCSHTGYRTARDVIEHSGNPVIFSHSNPRALCDHPRNIPDELMKACAESGGVVGINGAGVFLGSNDTRSERIVEHIDCAVQLLGPAHVGLGLDYTFDMEELDRTLEAYRDTWPEELDYKPGIRFVEPEQMPEITEGLLKRGYPERHIRGILGGNFLRVAERVWK